MEVLISEQRIRQRVAELAAEIKAHYRDQPITIVGVLTGCLMFLADLVRHLDLPVRLALIQASSYRGTQRGELHVQADLVPDLRGRHVLLLDDILDTGRTLDHVVWHLRTLAPASLKIAVLLRKRGRQEVDLQADWCGFEIPNVFVIGYGLDYNDEYRHLPHVAVLPVEPRKASD
jgi:hypoxanthine phosphoribosyltransferase